MSAKTELAVLPPREKALQVFQTEKGLDPYLKHIRDQIDAFVPDVSTRKGRDAIASIAYTVARSKTALDNRGKELVAELKEIPNKIDAERKRVRETLDAWQEEVRRPLTEWQAEEDARIDLHNDAIQAIKNRAVFDQPPSAAQVEHAIAELEPLAIDDSWDEFLPEAARAKDQTLIMLRAVLVQRREFEAEQAELARLRAEAEARAQADRDAAIAREAAERAQNEAEQRAQAEREAAARREQQLIEEANAQKRAAEQAARAAQQAEADRIAAQQQAERDRVAAAQRQAQAVENARLEEVARQKAEAAEALRQQEQRAADTAHKAAINRAALEAFIAGGMPESCAKQAVTLIAQRRIPSVSISY